MREKSFAEHSRPWAPFLQLAQDKVPRAKRLAARNTRSTCFKEHPVTSEELFAWCTHMRPKEKTRIYKGRGSGKGEGERGAYAP